MAKHPTLSVVVPLYNEAAGFADFHAALSKAVTSCDETYEIIYCDDGSSDETVEKVIAVANGKTVKLLCLSRNFGKEAALAAGYGAATGKAVVSLDGDGQHPVELLPRFIEQWRSGAQVVVGVRRESVATDAVKRLGSRLFYWVAKHLLHQDMTPGSTDYRLLDAAVVKEFRRLEESGRMSRNLVDWLGFKREYIEFDALPRLHGSASYSLGALVRLATQTILSLSFMPLYVSGFLGIVISCLSGLLGLAVIIEQLILGDPLRWNFTGTAMLGIAVLFMVGVVLVAIGVLSVYVAEISNEVRRRPLYVIDESRSVGITTS